MLILPVLWTGFFVINFNVAMMSPLLPFVQRDIGLSTAAAGMILAVFPVAALVANLVLGPLIDRHGRKRFIVAGAALSAAVLLLTSQAGSAVGIALGRAAIGLAMPMVGASVFAAIADYVAPADRPRVSGIVTSAAPVAFLCSMSLGVVLGGLLAWQLPLLLLAATCAVLALAGLTLPATDPAARATAPVTLATYRQRLSALSPAGGARWLFGAYICWSAGLYVVLGLYPSWLVQHGMAGAGAPAIGGMLFVGELGGLSGALLSAAMARRFGHPLAACAAACLGLAVLVVMLPLGRGVPVAQAVAYALFAGGRDLSLALILSGAMLVVPAARRGSVNATLNALYLTGATGGGMASAWLYALRPDFAANAAAAAALFAAAALMLRSLVRSYRPAHCSQ